MKAFVAACFFAYVDAALYRIVSMAPPSNNQPTHVALSTRDNMVALDFGESHYSCLVTRGADGTSVSSKGTAVASDPAADDPASVQLGVVACQADTLQEMGGQYRFGTESSMLLVEPETTDGTFIGTAPATRYTVTSSSLDGAMGTEVSIQDGRLMYVEVGQSKIRCLLDADATGKVSNWNAPGVTDLSVAMSPQDAELARTLCFAGSVVRDSSSVTFTTQDGGVIVVSTSGSSSDNSGNDSSGNDDSGDSVGSPYSLEYLTQNGNDVSVVGGYTVNVNSVMGDGGAKTLQLVFGDCGMKCEVSYTPDGVVTNATAPSLTNGGVAVTEVDSTFSIGACHAEYVLEMGNEIMFTNTVGAVSATIKN